MQPVMKSKSHHNSHVVHVPGGRWLAESLIGQAEFTRSGSSTAGSCQQSGGQIAIDLELDFHFNLRTHNKQI